MARSQCQCEVPSRLPVVAAGFGHFVPLILTKSFFNLKEPRCTAAQTTAKAECWPLACDLRVYAGIIGICDSSFRCHTLFMSFWARRGTNIYLTTCNLQNPASRNSDGLEGEQISLTTARILQVVSDSYHALTTERPYRVAMPRRSHSQRSGKKRSEDGRGISLLDEFESVIGALAASDGLR